MESLTFLVRYSRFCLFQYEHSRGCLAPEYIHFGLLRERALVDGVLYGVLCDGGVVVFLAEVAKPDVAGAVCEVLGEHFPADGVVEMSVAVRDAPLEPFGVRSVLEHFCVEVGFYDEIARALYIRYEVLAESAAVCDEAEGERLAVSGLRAGFGGVKEVFRRFGLRNLDEIPVAVAGIVHDLEGGDAERPDVEGGVGRGEALQVLWNLLRHHAVAVDAAVDEF